MHLIVSGKIKFAGIRNFKNYSIPLLECHEICSNDYIYLYVFLTFPVILELIILCYSPTIQPFALTSDSLLLINVRGSNINKKVTSINTM